MTDEMYKKYWDMLIQQSYSNEEKAGSNADSVASKLEFIKNECIINQKIVQNIRELSGTEWIVQNNNPNDTSINDLETLANLKLKLLGSEK